MSTEIVQDHAFEIEEDDGALRIASVVHPPTCLAIHHWSPDANAGGLLATAPHLYVERPRCVIDYQSHSVGLNDEYAVEIDYDGYLGGREAVLAIMHTHAQSGEPMPVRVEVYYGWTASTPVGESEYEFEFAWRPREDSEQ